MAFLQYRPGAIPGKAFKRKLTTEESRERKKQYENNRERKFVHSWMQGRDWLKHDNERNVMVCTWCIEANGSNDISFVKGCENLKISAIKDHENSKFHLKIAPRFTVSIEESPAAQCIKQLNQNDMNKLSIKFRNAHYIAKHNKPFTEFEQLCQLDKIKGLDVGTSYINRKGAVLLVKSISAVTNRDVVESIKESKFMSFTCDGCTDFTGDEYESLYIRHAKDGIIYDSFFKIGIPESGCSADIKSFITSEFEAVGLLDAFNKRLVGFCADGASNMQGKKTGLAGLLLKDRPELVVIHCLAHGVELSFKDAIAKNKLYDKVITLLLGLYYLYRKSPKMKKGLNISFKSLHQTRVLPTRVGGTRWLPHLTRAINNFEKGYKAIRNHLETASHENPKAEGLAKLAADGNVLTFMISLKVVIAELTKLSLGLQKEGLTLADACIHLSLAKQALSNLKNENEIIQEILSGKYQGLEVKFRGQMIDCKIEILANGMMEYINKRIPDSPVIKATSISNFGNWPCDKSDLSGYGNDEVLSIIAHFEKSLKEVDVDVSLVPAEWEQLKILVFEKFKTKLEQCSLTWKEVNRLKLLGFKLENVLAVIDLVMSLPPTSVRNECSFSIMKLTKGKRRAKMNPETLNNLLTVGLMGPAIEDYNPKESIDQFLITPSGRSRRIQGYKKKAKSVAGVTEAESNVVDVQSESENEVQTDSQNDNEINTSTSTSDASVGTETSTVYTASSIQTERLLQQFTSNSNGKFSDDDDDDDDDDEYSDDEDDNEMNEDQIDKLLFLYSRD